MLYSPERHVTLPPVEWEPTRVHAWLQRWASDALECRDGLHWPAHPRDLADVEGSKGPFMCLYFGSAGVWVALARLAKAGVCRLPMALAEIFEEVLADYVRTPDTGERVPSWFLGESALLTACCLARPDEEKARRLATMIEGNRANPTLEALWGAPGTMTAAMLMYERTGEARWAALARDSADALWDSWYFDEAQGAWVWEQDLYGAKRIFVGAGHGWVGNLHALWRCQALLSDERRGQTKERTLQGLTRFAMVEDDVANWPTTLVPREDKVLVQWCHGAPGIITSLRYAELPEALPLLEKAARLIVRAGPLSKGVGVCHGTDGNGVALLEMHRRTGDAVWLARAREFAMWAIGQSEATREEYGQWRYGLWTGDAGLACFLLDCLAGRGEGMPGLDMMW